VTGADVRDLREKLGWTGAQFASLFGVHPSTVYRWEEREKDALKTEPLQLQLLTVLRAELKRSGRRDVCERLEAALALGGSLRALHVLLSMVYSEASP
jgi:transcriptional regulator with XRE-family HTH domain